MRQTDGYTSVSMKDGGAYCARYEDFTRLIEEFKAGRAFLEFDGLYGHYMVLKTALVDGIILCPPDAIEAQRKDKRESEKEDNNDIY